MAVKFAWAMGAEVTAFSSTPDKETETKEFGAHHFQKWGSAEELKELQGSFDLILSAVSSAINWDLVFSLLSNNGVLCFVGIPVSSINLPLIALIFGQKIVAGSVVGGRQFMREMLDFAAFYQITPMVQTMPLTQINEAIDKVLANQARYRIVLVSE